MKIINWICASNIKIKLLKSRLNIIPLHCRPFLESFSVFWNKQFAHAIHIGGYVCRQTIWKRLLYHLSTINCNFNSDFVLHVIMISVSIMQNKHYLLHNMFYVSIPWWTRTCSESSRFSQTTNLLPILVIVYRYNRRRY